MKSRCKIVIALLCALCVLQCFFVVQSCQDNKNTKNKIEHIIADLNQKNQTTSTEILIVIPEDHPSFKETTNTLEQTTATIILEDSTTSNTPVSSETTSTLNLFINIPPPETEYYNSNEILPGLFEENETSFMQETTYSPSPEIFVTSPPIAVLPPISEKKPAIKKPVIKDSKKKVK